jgi:type IV pilus assembly protein PilA
MTTPSSKRLRNRRRAGFSLVEMIGVLAIIAILAVVIVPKVFSTIASSRITQTIGSVTSMKSAISEFSGKYGTVPVTTANSRIDDLLMAAGMLEGRFVVKIGQQPSDPVTAGATWTYANGAWTAAGGASQASESRIAAIASSTAAPSAAVGANFRLDGTADLPAGSRVVYAVVSNLLAKEALELSLRLDGDNLSEADSTTADNAGKVVYAAPDANGITDAYVYVAHQ